ncbi:hypothetical protein [Aurantimonas marina]|uniref:hypothetical protein n=1 Tax=Aurantimonas marina TaxID=2780508 RepID=UPI0019CFA0C8|nr:hypothetical protein [Aurantimonas marina]
MDAKEAARLAKKYLTELFADEEVFNLGLEEISFDDRNGAWNITLGFSREWNVPRNILSPLGGPSPSRDYRIVTIRDSDQKVLAVKIRDLAA